MKKEQIIFHIPSEMKTELKIIAAKQNKTITEILTQKIKEYIAEYNRKA